MSSSSVEGLRERLAVARAQRAEVEAQREALREADALKKLQDDHDALAKEVETARSNGDALTETLTSRKEYIQNAPSETQLLKLERRLETVKQSLAEVHKSTEQLNTGIDAYRERSRTCSAARRELASDYLEKASKSTLDEVLLQCEGEKQSKSSESILQAIDALIAICEDRESVLLDLNQQYSAKLDEDAKISARIADLHSLVEAELPRLEAEADRFVREITAAWTREKHALTEVYEKLYAVNKEQQYHLQRGTHVKPAPGQTTPGHELALSARHARLSAQLIEARERLGELNAENAFTKRVSDQLRHEGRDSVQRFELLRQDVQDRLKLAQQERGNAEEESRRFRNLKADLQDALQAIRETPSGATKTA